MTDKNTDKNIKSVDTKNGVTTITYEDGSTRVEHPGGVVTADTISGGVSFN